MRQINFPVKISALTTKLKDVIYLSLSYSIKKLLNIKEEILEITSIVDEKINGTINKVIYATATKNNSNCPCCSNRLVKNGNKIVSIKILKNCQYNSILRVKKQRYFCKNCNKSFLQKLNFVDKNCSISNDIKLAIKLELKEVKTVKAIAKEFNVSQSTVARIIDSFDEYKVNYNYLPEKLCFDEFKSTKDSETVMSFVYCNAENSEIIDVVESRKLNSLREYFCRFTKEARNNVKHIVIDMYKPYISLIKEMFPNAKISIDRFHLVQLINRAFNKLRILVMNKQDERMYNKLKKYWKLLLKNSCELSSSKEKRGKMFDYKYLSEEDIVKILLSCDKELEKAYELYQSFLIAIKEKKFKKFKKILKDNYCKFKNLMKVSLKTFKKYLEYIENSLNYEYSNGKLEGINRKIKVLKYISYGYRSFVNFRKRILLCTSILKSNSGN